MQLLSMRWAFIRMLLLLLDTQSSLQTEHEQLHVPITNDDYELLPENVVEVNTPDNSEVEQIFEPQSQEPFVEDQVVKHSDTQTPVVEKMPEKITEYQRPSCEKGKGCNKPLECFDFSTLGKDSPVPDPPRAVKVTPLELEAILENKLYENCCAIVMFYAPWCEFSSQFARRFNAIGRTFSELPVLAVDLGENEP